jgi:hypothetical protein
MLLPEKISIATGWYNGEVSRSHSTYGKRVVANCIGLTGREEQNVILPEIRTGASVFVIG